MQTGHIMSFSQVRLPPMARAVGVGAYWLLTGIVAAEMAAGSLWDMFQIPFVRGVFEHLGYPLYMLTIIGVWKLPCAVALMLPRFPRAKEWAYAGAFFNYTGAAASHAFVGDAAGKWGGPLVFALMTVGSWALRPADRRLAPQASETAVHPRAWIASLVVLVAMVIFGYWTTRLPMQP
jgi:hypothetical protein